MSDFREHTTRSGDVVPLLPAAPKSADALERFTVTFRALPGDPRPPAVRLRQLLKYAKRAQALANEGIADAPPGK